MLWGPEKAVPSECPASMRISRGRRVRLIPTEMEKNRKDGQEDGWMSLHRAGSMPKCPVPGQAPHSMREVRPQHKTQTHVGCKGGH